LPSERRNKANGSGASKQVLSRLFKNESDMNIVKEMSDLFKRHNISVFYVAIEDKDGNAAVIKSKDQPAVDKLVEKINSDELWR
jgi:DNA polymerase II small subunit/DNA polymerase delta subunit B